MFPCRSWRSGIRFQRADRLSTWKILCSPEGTCICSRNHGSESARTEIILLLARSFPRKYFKARVWSLLIAAIIPCNQGGGKDKKTLDFQCIRGACWEANFRFPWKTFCRKWMWGKAAENYRGWIEKRFENDLLWFLSKQRFEFIQRDFFHWNKRIRCPDAD